MQAGEVGTAIPPNLLGTVLHNTKYKNTHTKYTNTMIRRFIYCKWWEWELQILQLYCISRVKIIQIHKHLLRTFWELAFWRIEVCYAEILFKLSYLQHRCWYFVASNILYPSSFFSYCCCWKLENPLKESAHNQGFSSAWKLDSGEKFSLVQELKLGRKNLGGKLNWTKQHRNKTGRNT